MAGERKVSILIKARDQASKVFGRVRGAGQRLRDTLVGPASLAGAFAGLFSIYKAGSFIRDSIRAFGVQEEAVESLRAALIATGKDGAESLDQLTAAAARLQKTTTIGDEATIAATASLAALAKDLPTEALEQAQEAMVGLADAFFKGDVNSAALQLGKTLGGPLNTLSRYGIVVDAAADSQTKLAQIMDQSAGFFEIAEARANTLNGRLRQLSNAWGDLKEQVGDAIVQAAGMTANSKALKLQIEGWTQSITDNKAEWIAWIRVVGSAFKFAGAVFIGIGKLAFNAGQAIGSGLREGIYTALTGMAAALNLLLIDPINMILEGIDRIPKVDLDFRINRQPTDKYLAEITKSQEGFTSALGDMVTAMDDVEAAWEDLAAASARAADAEGDAVDESKRRAAQMAETAAATRAAFMEAEATLERQLREQFRRQTPDTERSGAHFEGQQAAMIPSEFADAADVQAIALRQGLVEPLEDMAGLWQPNITGAQELGHAIGQMVNNQRTLAQVNAEIIAQLLGDWTNAWETATKNAIEGSQSVGQALAGAFLGSIAAAARAESQFYAAKALAAVGIGLLGDPRGFAAAAKFAAASAAFAAVAGALGAAQGAIGGGGGGAAGTASAAESTIGSAKQEATIIIEGGFLDMNDPRQEESFRRAMEDLTGRRVTVIGRE